MLQAALDAAQRVADDTPNGVGAVLDTGFDLSDVTVGSAGVWTPGGQPMWPPAAHEARAFGLDPSRFRSRSIDGVPREQMDLVLTATGLLRDDVLRSSPALAGRVLTMREAAYFLSAAPPYWGDNSVSHRILQIPAHAHAVRSRLAPLREIDIEDPAGRSPATIHRLAIQTHDAVSAIAAAMLLTAPTEGDRLQ